MSISLYSGYESCAGFVSERLEEGGLEVRLEVGVAAAGVLGSRIQQLGGSERDEPPVLQSAATLLARSLRAAYERLIELEKGGPSSPSEAEALGRFFDAIPIALNRLLDPDSAKVAKEERRRRLARIPGTFWASLLPGSPRPALPLRAASWFVEVADSMKDLDLARSLDLVEFATYREGTPLTVHFEPLVAGRAIEILRAAIDAVGWRGTRSERARRVSRLLEGFLTSGLPEAHEFLEDVLAEMD